MGSGPSLKSTAIRCSGRVMRSIQPPQDHVPDMALEGGEVERTQLTPHARKSAPKILGMVHKIRDDAPRVRFVEPCLGLGPALPELAEDLFLDFRAWSVRGIRRGQGKIERPVVVTGQPRPRDEVAIEPDRAEPLIVKIVGKAVGGNLSDRLDRSVRSSLRQVAQDHHEPVAAELVRPVRRGDPSDRLELEARRFLGVLARGPPGSTGTGLLPRADLSGRRS